MKKINLYLIFAALCITAGMQAMEQKKTFECGHGSFVAKVTDPVSGTTTNEWRLYLCSYKHFILCKKDPVLYLENGELRSHMGCTSIGFPNGNLPAKRFVVSTTEEKK